MLSHRSQSLTMLTEDRHQIVFLSLFIHVGGLAHESAVNRGSTSLIALNRSTPLIADLELQDRNFVGSLDRFAKTAGSHDSVNSIFTHVYPHVCLRCGQS